MVSVSLLSTQQRAATPGKGSSTLGEQRGGCQANPDPMYNRQKVLRVFANVLNTSAPGFKEYERGGFRAKDEMPVHFFVYDLADPSNKSTRKGGCINLLDAHIYHFAAGYIPFSLSHVAVLKGGKITVFRAINCQNSKDKLEDVIEFVRDQIPLDDRGEILERVKDYRKYGDFHTVDDLWIRCTEIDRRKQK
jgi:hypothetical protein